MNFGNELNQRTEGLDVHARIALDLGERGWSLCEDFLPPLLVSQLRSEARELWRGGCFRPAGVGRGQTFEVRPEVRNDWVYWLYPEACSGAQQLFLNALEALRLALNRQLYLGLFEYEGHLAVYRPGSYYRKHLDRFEGSGPRTLSCILYLNSGWDYADGGQLRIYTDRGNPERYREILPLGGRLVCFYSDRFLHQVMPARRSRFSITGWFRQRA
jgi:SM-20-related protein